MHNPSFLNAKFIIFNTQFLVLNTKFMICFDI